MNPDSQSIKLKNNETAIIGYGSLLSRSSVSKTLSREYDGPFVTCHLRGWRRSWDVAMPNSAFYFMDREERVYPENILYLNVRSEPSSSMNCVLFTVNQQELEAMHDREWIYDPVDVTANLSGVQVQGGRALLYVGRQDYLCRFVNTPRTSAIRSSYVRILDEALQKMNSDFQAEYKETTDPIPEHLVVEDMLDPDRPNPWANAGRDYQP